MARGTPVEDVIRMTKQGINESQIIGKLTDKGFSPVQIHDALNQSKIRGEMSAALPTPPPMEQGFQKSMVPTALPKPTAPPMLPAMQQPAQTPRLPPVPTQQAPAQTLPPAQHSPQLPALPAPPTPPEAPVPKPSAVPPTPQQTQPLPSQVPQAPTQPETYPYDYPTYSEQPAPQMDTAAIEELAEEIVNEKWQEVKSKISDVVEWKSYAERRIVSIDERIKRLESTIDRLQAALLAKVNEYGRGVKDLGAEMSSLEGALGKILSPLVENVKELGAITEELKKKSKTKTVKKKK